MKTEENVVFADDLLKRRRSAAKFLEFDTRVNIVCRLTVKCVLCCLPRNAGLLVHIKLVLLLLTSMRVRI